MLKWFLAQKLWVKILLPSLVPVVLLVGSGTFSFFLIRAQAGHQAMLESSLSESRQVTEILKQYAESQTKVYKAVTFAMAGLSTAKSDEMLGEVIALKASLEKGLKDWQTQLENPKAKVAIDSALQASAQYYRWVGEIQVNIDDPVSAASNMVTTEKKFLLMQEHLSLPRRLVEEKNSELSALVQQNLARLQSRQSIVTLVVILISLGLSLLALRLIMAGVRRAEADVLTVAEGDLSHVVERTTGDEVGALAEAVDSMRLKMQILIGQVKGSAQTLNLTAMQINGLSNNLQHSSRTIGDRTQTIVQASHAMTDHADQMNSSASEVSQAAESTSYSLKQLHQTIREIQESCNREVEMARTTKETSNALVDGMKELQVASDEIGSILGLINSVASKTRLLALNATIEAAAAGEAGKGFAVVAGEVKELALQSTLAANQIQEKIVAVQMQSERQHEAVVRIAAVIDQFAEIALVIAAAVEEQAATVSSMSQSMYSVTTSVNQLEAGISDVSQRSRNVLGAVNDVAKVIDEAGAWVQETSVSAQKLQEMSHTLSDRISIFRV